MDGHDVGELLTNLGDLQHTITSDPDAVDYSKLCDGLVSHLSHNASSASQVGELLASLSSKELFRAEAGKSGVLFSLVPFLSSPAINVRLQILRAIGNLCIDNDHNREILLTAGGCQALLHLVDKCADSSSDAHYKRVLCGCVLNFAADNEKVCERLLVEGALDKMSLLLNLNQPQDVTAFGLEVLNMLVEAGSEENLKSPVFLNLLVYLLKSVSGKTCGLVLDLIKAVIEKDKEEHLSLKLVDLGIPKELAQMEAANFQQQAMDIVILFLRKDKCMEVLFKTGEILSIAMKWLESPTQSQVANAALVIANMARSDSNCIFLVEKGVVMPLVALLDVDETEQMKGKFHYAVLCALRNLSLPPAHKEMFFTMGVVDSAIRAVKRSTMPHVQFKAIGILRLLVDGQAATGSYIVSNTLEHLCKVCEECGISHVQFETGRLLCAVVKYSQENTTIVTIAKEGGMKWIYCLLESKQPQLIAEALIALNIIIVICEEGCALLAEEAGLSLPTCLSSILTSSYPLNLVNNSLVLLRTLLSTDLEIKEPLKSNVGIKQAVEIFSSHDNEDIRLKSNEILSNLL